MANRPRKWSLRARAGGFRRGDPGRGILLANRVFFLFLKNGSIGVLAVLKAGAGVRYISSSLTQRLSLEESLLVILNKLPGGTVCFDYFWSAATQPAHRLGLAYLQG